MAGDEPVIGTICPDHTLAAGQTSATIWVDDVTTTGTLDRLWALITPPQPRLGSLGAGHGSAHDRAERYGPGTFEGGSTGFSHFGTYTVVVYAMDTEGNISLPKETTVLNQTGPDVYEPDNTYAQATILPLSTIQRHNFHEVADEDWVQFSPMYRSDQPILYVIETFNAEENSDTMIELYDTDGQTLLFGPVDEQGPGEGEFLEWYVPAAGIYYVRVRQSDPGVYGEGTGYDLRVYKPVQPGDGWIQGTVKDKSTGDGLGNATITLAELPEFEHEKLFERILSVLCGSRDVHLESGHGGL